MSIAAKKIMMGSGAVALPSDDQFNRVSFLSHFDGANNGVNNAFDDGSASNHTITANGNVTQGSFGPFARPDGEWGVAMPSGPILNNNYAGSVEVASHSDFTLSGQYTIEFFVNSRTLKTAGGTNTVGFFAVGAENNANSMNLFNTGTTIKYWDSSQYKTFGSSSDFVTNSWVHFAVCRNSSNVITCFVNGTALGTTFSDTTTPQGQVVIGAELYNTTRYNSVDGFISNFRILNGTCLYTSNFTAPTSALTAITNTKLLTCQSNRFVDNSASAHAVTVTGAPAVTAFGPFLTSAVYDATVNGASSQLGATNYVHIADGAWKTLGTGDFTWEYWIYPIGENAYHVGDATAGTNISSTFTLGISGKRAILYYSIQGGEAYPLQSPDSAPYYNNNEWHHFAYVRSGNDHKLYVNGILRNSETRSGTMVDSTGQFNIGNFGEGYAIGAPDGIYCDVRLVKGTAVYSGSTYTVPTAPLTAISNTELLVNFKDGQAIDSTAQNNLTLYGTAKTSTAQKKFGTASLLLDGNSDFAYLHNRNNLSGPFCIEAWGWADNLPSGGCTLWCLGTYKIELQVTNDTVRIYRVGTAEGYTNFFTGGEFSADTWHHVAIVRDTSNVIKCYLNGTASSTTVTDATAFLATSGIFIIGAEADGDPVNQNVLDPWDGYIDDFRISNFARYTSNFTAPTKAFADKGQ